MERAVMLDLAAAETKAHRAAEQASGAQGQVLAMQQRVQAVEAAHAAEKVRACKAEGGTYVQSE
jgi:hypothetical protein